MRHYGSMLKIMLFSNHLSRSTPAPAHSDYERRSSTVSDFVCGAGTEGGASSPKSIIGGGDAALDCDDGATGKEVAR